MPHFTIEVQGETNPLNSKTVYDTLVKASGGSHDVQGIKVATEQLSNWERQPNFYSFLQDIYANQSLDQNIRFQAIIQLKNGVDKHWRKGSTSTISKEEKLRIRSYAIEAGVQEPIPSLSLHNALMIAKIVRYEFPIDWPDVITLIISHLRKTSQPECGPRFVANILIITLQAVKELATGRLQRTRRSLQSAALELFQVLGGIYVQLINKWLPLLPNHESSLMLSDLENSYFALKTIRRLLIAGFENPHRETEVQSFWVVLEKHQTELLSLWNHAETSKKTISQSDEAVAKHLLQMAKLHLEMVRTHPASFTLLPEALGILSHYWDAIMALGKRFASELSMLESKTWTVNSEGDRVNDISLLEKLSLKGLLILRSCIKLVYQPTQTFKYQQPEDKEDKKASVRIIKSKVLSEGFVLNLMETLVTQFFILRPSDLRDWEEEPDEWEKREEEIADAWEYSIRSCSEKLFLDLVINYKELLVPRLLKVFEEYASPSNNQLFLKDSLYCAIGIAAPCLEDTLDFNTFLLHTLVPEAQIVQPHYNLLRRRISLLLGQWVPIKPAAFDRQAIYQIFAHFLSQGDILNDMVVRVTAGRQLRLVIEPFEFDPTEFLPFATVILENLMTLIRETELSETKMALLETVRVIVTRLETRIEPYAGAIMSMLPSLWAESGEEHLMKQAILTMIAAIVVSLKERSLIYHPPILSLISDSVQPNSEASVYLLEEAIELWAAILQQTPATNPSPSVELLSLAVNLPTLAELGSDSLGQIFELIESYILLSPQTMLSTSILEPLLNCLKPMFIEGGISRVHDFQKAAQVIETLISSINTPLLQGDGNVQHSLQHLLSVMIKTGFLQVVLATLHGAYQYHLDPRPSRKPPEIVGPKETSLFSVLSRLFFTNASLAIDAIEAVAGMPDVMIWLITEWISSFDSIASISERKLQALALTSLLSGRTPPPKFMLEQLQSLMTLWTDIIIALGDEAPEESQGDYLWYGATQQEMNRPGEDSESERKRILSLEDPVHKINIRAFISQKLEDLVSAIGGPNILQEQWLSQIDAAVIDSFKGLGVL